MRSNFYLILSVYILVAMVDERIAQDKDKIAQHVCPVCDLKMSTQLKNPRRSLQQHICRSVEAEHRLWCNLYWRIHFVMGGYRLRPKDHSLEEIAAILNKYFNKTPVTDNEGVHLLR
jgi:hypothetical protein